MLLGLPATGPTERIIALTKIATRDPITWSREEFDRILPHLSVHQDVRGGADVDQVLREGLSRGMVDPAAALEPGATSWSWARRYLGKDVFVLITGSLRFRHNMGARLGPGNFPLFHVRPTRSGSLWQAILERAITLPETCEPGGRRSHPSLAVRAMDTPLAPE